MKHLMGLLRPDSGHIWVDGEDVVPMNDDKLNMCASKIRHGRFSMRRCSIRLPSSRMWLSRLVEHTKKSKAEIHELVINRLQSLGLRNIEKKFPAELSGGMRKRVGSGSRARAGAGDSVVR